MRFIISACQAHIPVWEQDTMEADKVQRPNIHWAPTVRQCFRFFAVFNSIFSTWGLLCCIMSWYFILSQKMLYSQKAGSQVWLPQIYLSPFYYYSDLSSLPGKKNIFTPISNQAKVLAPFKFQLKRQALPANSPPCPPLSYAPSSHLDSSHSPALGSHWTREEPSTQVLFEKVLFCLLIRKTFYISWVLLEELLPSL